MKRRKPARRRSAKLDRAIAEVSSPKAQIEAAIDELKTVISRLHHSAREHEEMAQELRQRGVLDREVEKAIAKLKVTFRDGPVQINASLIKLAQDILQEQIRSVLQDQMQRIAKQLALIAREEVQAEVYAAVREAIADQKLDHAVKEHQRERAADTEHGGDD